MSEISKQENDESMSLSRISALAKELNTSIAQAIDQVMAVNVQTRMLSFNAQIEAARAGGSSGAAFAVVAQAIQELSDRTSGVTKDIKEKTQGTIREVNRISELMADKMLGTRLADLALNNIDLIDRNLYERTCDVRWWATDSSLVNALSTLNKNDLSYASKRLGVILSAYTVYYDLVLVDLEGRVVANGRPDLYRSVGLDVSAQQWYQSACRTRSGDEYGFETCHESLLVGNKRVLAYSCLVREGGEACGRPLGVLGILFNWDDLAQVIVERTPLPQEEWKRSLVGIMDDRGNFLAVAKGDAVSSVESLDASETFAKERSYQELRFGGRPAIVAHALAPGYETYSTGWRSVIVQLRESSSDIGVRARGSTGVETPGERSENRLNRLGCLL